MSPKILARLPMLAAAMLSLILAVWAGLQRLPVSVGATPGLAAAHGPLMVCGFVGTLIALERALALRAPWAFAAPVLSGAGGLVVATLGVHSPGPWLLFLASLALMGSYVAILRQHAASFTITMNVGATCWLAGNGLWLAGWPIFRVAPWWAAFLVLTIAGERLDLSRVRRPSRLHMAAFAAAVALLLAGLAALSFAYATGIRAMGIGLLGIAAWLWRFDIARATVKGKDLVRFVALCLLAGYVWLAVAAGIALVGGERVIAGPWYDAFLHAIFLGFVISMIFGHAPIIFPSVIESRLPYSPAFYTHVALLHASVALRVAGDLAVMPWWRAAGGVLSAVAIAVFLVNNAVAVIRERNRPSAN